MNFGFGLPTEDATAQQDQILSLSWYPAEEIILDDLVEEQKIKCPGNVSVYQTQGLELKYLTWPFVINSLKRDPTVDSHVAQAEENHSDLIPSKYEGGLKIWECTYDVAKHIASQGSLFKGKNVLDMGCGSGLLGLASLKLGAHSAHFQDYNKDVLKHWTIPNAVLNGAESMSRFWCGDWGNFAEQTDTLYDIILSSETIYNPDNYKKICTLLEKRLKVGGIAFIAGKSYYFGVGGGMKQFQSLLVQNEKLCSEVVWKSSDGS